jgi:hypothetical protein
MKKLIAATLVIISLPVATANAADLNKVTTKALAIQPVPCKHPKIDVIENPQGGALGLAYIEECRVEIKASHVRDDSNAYVCSTLVHEFTHLTGATFPENKSDPYHSSNPANWMYGQLVFHPKCGTSDQKRLNLEAEKERHEIIITDKTESIGELRESAKEYRKCRRQLHCRRGIKRIKQRIKKAKKQIAILQVRLTTIQAELQA